MSDLTAFAAHCRKMAGAEHQTHCRAERAALAMRGEMVRSCGDREPHDGHKSSRWTYCPGVCPGCVTDADRALWTHLADEVDAYLDPHPTLWGDGGAAGTPEFGPASRVSPDPRGDDSAREGTL